MTFGGAFVPTFSGVFDRGAATRPWWNPGGTFTAVAAYQPNGAASLSASYTNLVTPGTYNAAPGVAPTWAAGTGWTFNGTSQYLTTGVVITQFDTWSIFARFSSHAIDSTLAAYLFGVRFNDVNAVARNVGANPSGTAVSNRRYLNGSAPSAAGGAEVASGVIGIAGTTGYYNGTADATLNTTSPLSPSGNYDLWIGWRNEGSYAQNQITGLFYQGNIEAIAIYSTTLSATQVATLTTQMNAL